MIWFLLWTVAADSAGPDTTEIVYYQARQIQYDLERELVILNDSAVIQYQDLILVSDSAYYHVRSRYLEAFGRCHLREHSDSLKGDYLKYNLNTRKALMAVGHTQIDKGYLSGDKIFLVDTHTVNVRNGTYTTCNHQPPHYYFYSPEMKLYVGDMVIARPIVLYVEGLPVLAAPFWFVPVSSRRKSGLLPFRAGNARDFGKNIRGLAYYLVINDYADLTFQLDAMEKKGYMPQIEGVWNYSPFTSGTILTSYIREIDTGRRRYHLQARNNSPYFIAGSNFNCDIKYLSDITYQTDYEDTTPLWVNQEIVSQGTLNRDLGGFRNSLNFERRENFTDTTIFERLPAYAVNSPSGMLFSAVAYSFSGHVSRDRYEEPGRRRRTTWANLHSAPSMKQSISGLFTVSPQISLDATIYDRDTLGTSLPYWYGYTASITANTDLFRIYPLEFLSIHGLLHKLTPALTYSFTPDLVSGRFPQITGVTVPRRASALRFSLGQDFEVKHGANQAKANVLHCEVSSGYNLLTDTLAPISANFTLPINPFPPPLVNFSLLGSGQYDSYTQDIAYSFSNAFTIKLSWFTLNWNHSYTKGTGYQCWFTGDLKPTRNWAINYSARYDLPTRRLVDYSLTLTRNLHCWEGIFSFHQLGDIWRYDFKVRIKQIPEVALGKGLLGYIFE